LEFLPLALSECPSFSSLVFIPQKIVFEGHLDSELAVAKYAFFCAFHSGTGKEMIAADGTLTDLGKIYVS
jgi:hypothetical protein